MTVAELYGSILSARYFDLGREEASYRIQRIGRTMHVLFEWSDGVIDWRHNLTWLPIRVSLGGVPLHVHRGLYATYHALRERVMSSLSDARIGRVLIGGYSHGAALAALAFAELTDRRRTGQLVVGYGFGAPRVLWGTSAPMLFDGFFTVRCGTDAVTHLPPQLLGYRHVGELISLPTPDGRGPFACHAPDAYTEALAHHPFGERAVFSLARDGKKISKSG